MGPFVDITDGKTAETALSSQTGKIYKHEQAGANFTGSSWAHDANGMYRVGLSITHTDTLGRLRIYFYDINTYCSVWEDFVVLPANTYDSLYGSDRLQVDLREKGDATLGLTTQEKTDVNAEVVDTMGTDTLAELSQAQPPATPTLKQAIMLLYMALRNQTLTTASLFSVKNDAGTVIAKSSLSDSGTTFTRDKMVSGP